MDLKEAISKARLIEDQYVARKSWKNRKHVYSSYGFIQLAEGRMHFPTHLYERCMLAIGLNQVRNPDSLEVRHWSPYPDEILADDWFIGNEMDLHTQNGKRLKRVVSDDGLRFFQIVNE